MFYMIIDIMRVKEISAICFKLCKRRGFMRTPDVLFEAGCCSILDIVVAG